MRQSHHAFKFQTQDGKLNWDFLWTNGVEGPMETRSHKRDSISWLSRYNPSVNEEVPSRATTSVGAGQQSPAQLGRGLREKMIEFFWPNSRARLPTFRIIAQMGLILPRIPPPTPVLYSAITNPFWGYVCTRNIPNPTPKHPPFLARSWKWAKQNGP